MRYALVLLGMLVGAAAPVAAQIGVEIALPAVDIGINVPVYPDLVAVPDYPVYYAPGLDSNYFFYDGMYWVYSGDSWYSSSWYNGPWGGVDSDGVPLFILRVPVSYYRQPPAFFVGWQADAPPRWGDHWGPAWQQRRSGWDTWNHNAVPARAPLPTYQRQYAGAKYPQAAQQRTLQATNYKYQPKDAAVRQVAQRQAAARPAATPAAAAAHPVARTQVARPEAAAKSAPVAHTATPERATPERTAPERTTTEVARPEPAAKSAPVAHTAAPEHAAPEEARRPVATPTEAHAPMAREAKAAAPKVVAIAPREAEAPKPVERAAPPEARKEAEAPKAAARKPEENEHDK